MTFGCAPPSVEPTHDVRSAHSRRFAVARFFDSLNLLALATPVSWAGPAPAPVWLDVAREYTERWHHQQHIRDAIGQPGQTDHRFLHPVLATFAYALPVALQDA